MKALTTLATAAVVLATGFASAEHHEAIEGAIGNSNRAEANSERDGARKPDQVLEFIGLNAGDVVLDYGAGGGYWTELFSGVVGDGGKVYAHQRAGERYEQRKAAFTAQFSPFGNIELMPLDSGAALPLGDGSGRAESGGWHRTPPEMAKADIASVGFEFAGEAPEIFHNPDDDLKNTWYETGLRGKTTTFVQKYRKPE